MGRANLEQMALHRFEVIAERHKYRVFKGQSGLNRIVLIGSVYFQFGDLRVDTATHHIVVEAESAGGVTNLTKYWYCLADTNLSRQISKPIILFHIFRQVSENDYASHLGLWDFLWRRMEKDIGDHMKAFKYAYRDLADLEPAIRAFESSLAA